MKLFAIAKFLMPLFTWLARLAFQYDLTYTFSSGLAEWKEKKSLNFICKEGDNEMKKGVLHKATD